MEQVCVSCSLYLYDRCKNRLLTLFSFVRHIRFLSISPPPPFNGGCASRTRRKVHRYHFGLGDLIAHNGRGSRCGIVTVVGGRQTLLLEEERNLVTLDRGNTRREPSLPPVCGMSDDATSRLTFGPPLQRHLIRL